MLFRSLWGYATSGLLSYLLQRSHYAEIQPWKFGYGFSFSLLVVLAASSKNFKNNRNIGILMILLVSLINLQFGLRSLALIGFVSTLLLFLNHKSIFFKKIKFPRIRVAFSILFGVFLANISYLAFLNLGLLNQEQQNKFAIQSSGRLGILLGGRNEIVFSIRGIADSPLVGHGSRPAPSMELLNQGVDTLRNLGYSTSNTLRSALELNLIPTHSYLFQFWISSGIGAAIVWIKIFWNCINKLAKLIDIPLPMIIPTVYLTLNLMWNIFFSPYGSEARFSTAVAVVLLTFEYGKLNVNR